MSIKLKKALLTSTAFMAVMACGISAGHAQSTDGGVGGPGISVTDGNSVSGGAFTGGAGGAGGANNGGGDGGAGGVGALVSGANSSFTASGNVTGGKGGAGGPNTGAPDNSNGGAGGSGILVTGSNDTVTLNGGMTVKGGAGGAAGTGGGTPGAAGVAGNGIDLDGTGTILVNNDTIDGQTSIGINIMSANALASLTGTGSVTSANVTAGQGTFVFGADNGDVTLAAAKIANTAANNSAVALQISAAQTGVITNAGTIVANGTGAGLGVAVNFGANGSLTNAAGGTITGQIHESGNQTVTLTNAGTIDGDILLAGSGNSTIVLADGTLTGDITTGAGADRLALDGGAFIGAADLGAGDNILSVSGNYINSNNVTATGGTLTWSVETGKTLAPLAPLTVGDIIVHTGALIDIGPSLMTVTTATLLGTGEIRLSGAGGLDGDIAGSPDGSGVLNVDATATVNGDAGQLGASLAAIDIATGQTLTVNGDVNAKTTTLHGTGALTLSATDHDVNGDIVAAADGDGAIHVLDFAGTTAFDGNIGDDGKHVGSLDIAGPAAGLVTTTGNLYVNAITANAADTLQFIGGDQVVSGTITGGTLIVGDGAATPFVTFNGALTGLGSFDVKSQAGAMLAANLTTAGALTNNGTLEIGDGKSLTANTMTAGAGTFNFDFGPAQIAAPAQSQIVIVAGPADITGSKLDVTVGNGYIPNGTKFKVFDGTGTALGVTTAVPIDHDNTFRYSFTQVAGNYVGGDASDIYIVSRTVKTTPNNDAAGNAIYEIGPGVDPAIDAALASLNGATTDAKINDRLESLTPGVNGAAESGAITFNESVQRITETNLNRRRYASLESGGSGMAAGTLTNGMSTWLQGFGRSATQDRRDGIAGYDADTFGTSLGIDSGNIMPGSVLGLSVSYGKTNANSKNANTTGTDIDSYGANLYSSTDICDAAFVNAQIGYNYNRIKSYRHDVGAPDLTADAGYHSDQYSAKLALGKDYMTGNTGMILTPSVSAAYLHLKTDGYTEHGTGPVLTVNDQTLNSLKLGVGATAAWSLKSTDGEFLRPSLRAGYSYDTIDDNINATSQFVAGGPAFGTNGAKPARSEMNAGAGLTYVTASNWDVSANYDYTFKQDYDAHTGIVRVTSHF